MAILQPPLIAIARVQFLDVSSNCASRCFKSGHQFSTQDKVSKNVGGPWPRASWYVIQCFISSVMFCQNLSRPLIFLEKYLNMLVYLVSLLCSCCFSSCMVGGFFPMKRPELKKNCPPCYLCVARLHCTKISQIGCHQETDHQNIIITDVPIL